MCGIVYSKSLVGKPVNKTILKRYIFQRDRGTDGFGFYTPENNRLTHNPREGRILSLLRREKKATEILFHHRMPTSTMNVRNACHPFSTKEYFKYNYVGVHNGVLWNERELKAGHEQRGIDYVSEQEDGSFNDSEALIYDLASYIEGKVPMVTAEGSIAFIVIQRTHEGEPVAVYFGRNSGNPLMMKKTKHSFTLSSEGKGENIDVNTMYCYNYKTGVITRSPCRFPSYSQYSNGYGHYYGGNWYSEDDELREIEMYNEGYGINPHATRRYFEGETEAGRQIAAGHMRRLMEENYDNVTEAIAAGYHEIADLQKIEDSLRQSVEIDNTADDDDVDKFYSVGDRLYYLRAAVNALEGGTSGQSQIGFRYTPDHETYTREHNRLVRDRARERIDPLTGYAYYPYAD